MLISLQSGDAMSSSPYPYGVYMKEVGRRNHLLSGHFLCNLWQMWNPRILLQDLFAPWTQDEATVDPERSCDRTVQSGADILLVLSRVLAVGGTM